MQRPNHYTDCFEVTLDTPVSLATAISAFYSTRLFRIERAVLGAVGRGTTDAQVQALADGKVNAFAAWTVEARSEHQILLCDFAESTRSWLQVDGRVLRFGSAVVPRPNRKQSLIVRLLEPVHRLYSRGLLSAAARALT
jgi:hypothetical protein